MVVAVVLFEDKGASADAVLAWGAEDFCVFEEGGGLGARDSGVGHAGGGVVVLAAGEGCFGRVEGCGC